MLMMFIIYIIAIIIIITKAALITHSETNCNKLSTGKTCALLYIVYVFLDRASMVHRKQSTCSHRKPNLTKPQPTPMILAFYCTALYATLSL